MSAKCAFCAYAEIDLRASPNVVQRNGMLYHTICGGKLGPALAPGKGAPGSAPGQIYRTATVPRGTGCQVCGHSNHQDPSAKRACPGYPYLGVGQACAACGAASGTAHGLNCDRRARDLAQYAP